jgi:signal transduction histidine kinase
MEKKNKVIITNRLFFKVYINYALILAMFAILLGIIYMKLYETNIMDTYQNKLLKQATSISRKLSATIINNEEESYLEYYQVLSELDPENTDIWTISNPSATRPMSSNLETIDITGIKLPEDFVKVINTAFSNIANYEKGYYEESGGMSLIMGVPIIAYGEVVGVVLLISQVVYQNNIIMDSMKLIITSTFMALFISFIIATFFAKGISAPISNMRKIAIALTNGNYDSKTGIIRKDEIGDLAKSIDKLADELKENEAERLNREQVRVDFFANVSHELRTPLTVIRAYTESLVDGVVVEEERVNQYHSRILSECKGMERLVGDLLVLSKMQNPDFEIEKEPVNIAQVFDDLERNMQAICCEKNITLSVQKDNDVYMMMGDYDRLRQMFLIILDNAIKFSEEDSVVHILLSKKDKLRISIKDEGVGISEDELPIIFDKFYKSKLKQNKQGSGLGLAISKQIALKHEGTVSVYSTLGVGTEFVFEFQCLEEFVDALDI